MKLSVLPGRLLITRDPDVDCGMHGGVLLHYPQDTHSEEWAPERRAQTCYCHLHEPSASWDEEPLTGKRLLVTKWSDKEFTLEEKTFSIITEYDILAVLEGE